MTNEHPNPAADAQASAGAAGQPVEPQVDGAPIDMDGDESPLTDKEMGDEVVDPLAEAIRERDEYRDIALRLQADFENYRKRVAGQQTDEVTRATGKLADALLPVLDACEAAAAHGVTGIEAVWSALIGALQKQGLEALDLAGQPFDPEFAEAVMHEPGDGGAPVVSEVLRTGYRWKGKVLRAAMVKVRG